MQRDIVVKSRGLGGSADLTLLAPIKPGFVESLESVTYKTRIKRVLEVLHGARTASHEHATARLLSDSVERVGAIHSVRVAVLEPEDKVLLAVTFDGSWESYIRVLWDKVGTLLDLIFCGTVDYVTAADHSFEEWLEWARRVQVETGFFYGPPDASARDVLYHRRVELLRARGNGEEVKELQAVQPPAEEAVRRIVDLEQPKDDDPPVKPSSQERMVRERVRNGLQGLAALYRLTDLHRPFTPDGDVLRRAALYLLLEFVQARDYHLLTTPLRKARNRFARQLDWLFPDPNTPALPVRQVPAVPDAGTQIDPQVRADVQGGILRPYEGFTHGVMLLLAFKGPDAAVAFLQGVQGAITKDADPHDSAPGRVFCNVGLTLAGLRAAGVCEDTLELFPEEFRQGMAARAGLLGDVRNNHPRRWRLPGRFVGINSAPGAETIEMGNVHAVYQLRCAAQGQAALDAVDLRDPAHPLRGEVSQLLAQFPGVSLLAVQSLRRRYTTRNGMPVTVEHFGYADGDGQPEIEPATAPVERNQIYLGEIVAGHGNAADFEVVPSDPSVPEDVKERMRWLRNGSFLVVRKYRQFVDRMEQAVARTADDMVAELGGPKATYIDLVYGKLMGRMRNGQPLAQEAPGPLNDFNYDKDGSGQKCPLHAHIRRAHPRTDPAKSIRLPRLMRRSVSYGPAASTGDADRGLVFMAYNADLGEQYEVVQRWLIGGNSTGSSSGESCPIVGVPEYGYPRYFRFEHDGKAFRVQLENGTGMFDEPPALTRLEWGIYLFTPSLSAMQLLRAAADAAAAKAPAAAVPWQPALGRRLIDGLRRLEATCGATAAAEAWKHAIEDPDSIDRLDSAAIWAAIRDDHGGLLKTSYGTLVANRSLLAQVLLDPDSRYSISGQFERMKESVGEIFLGMDAGPKYYEESTPINQAAGALTATPADQERVFRIAFDAASAKLADIVQEAKEQANDVGDERFEVGFEARELIDEVLADLCDAWFGLKGSKFLRRGGSDWAWKEGDLPLYPGHFTALSRYMFQPNPGPVPAELARRYGKALRDAMTGFVAEHRANGTIPTQPNGSPAPIAAAVFVHPTCSHEDAWVARTMAGVMMGFIAPIIGAVLNVLREWHREERFATLRAELAGMSNHAAAMSVVAKPMATSARMRPMPQVIWRTVCKAHRLVAPGSGAVDLVVGDKIVLALVSATQESLGDGQDDGRAMFGGKREITPHPTHACPGHVAGLEAMLGTLTALLACPEIIRQGTAPLTFVVEGKSGFVPSPVMRVDAPHLILPMKFFSATPAVAPGPTMPQLPGNRTGLVLPWGDSWLDFGWGPVQYVDMRDQLESFGYTIPDNFCSWTKWGYAQYLADNAAEFRRFLAKYLKQPVPPRAILISAGGDDSTGDALEALLNEKAPSTPVLNDPALNTHIANLRGYYVRILDAIRLELTNPTYGRDIPVIVHGYDYPQTNPQGTATWLRTPFWNKGYKDPVHPGDQEMTDQSVATPAMRTLINRLNTMLAGLRQSYPFVRHVDLTGTIESHWTTDPTAGWANNLHPIPEAFALLALKIDTEIQKPYP